MFNVFNIITTVGIFNGNQNHMAVSEFTYLTTTIFSCNTFNRVPPGKKGV